MALDAIVCRGTSLTAQPSTGVVQAPLQAILDLREEHRREMGCQIVHDSWHQRGFTNSYLCRVDGDVVGYGSVGGPPREQKDIVKEFYVRRSTRHFARPLFRQLVEVSGARTLEAQTNDVLLTLMFFDCAVDWQSDTILFAVSGYWLVSHVTEAHDRRRAAARRDVACGNRSRPRNRIQAHRRTHRGLGARVRRRARGHRRDPLSLQSAVRRHLHGSCRSLPAERLCELLGPGAEAHLPWKRERSRRPLPQG